MNGPKGQGAKSVFLTSVLWDIKWLGNIDQFSNILLQTYTCDVFFAQSWKDDRLKWRKDDNITAKYRYTVFY